MLTLRPATLADVGYLSGNLRYADVREIAASSGLCAYDALEAGFRCGALVAVDAADTPVCIGGVAASDDPMVGDIWLLATPKIERHQISFLRRSRRWLEDWNDRFPLLTNAVDERNALHIRWLRWLGFTFIRRHPEFGVERRPFLEFVKINTIV